MFIASAEEMRALDRLAIQELGIPGVVLMENAGLRVVEVIGQVLGGLKGRKVMVLAGKGNNGGDGFVIARHLLNRGVEVKTLLLADPDQISGDARINLEILQKMGHKLFPAVQPNSLNILKVALAYTDLIVDAVYGTGFKGELDDHLANIARAVNESGKPVVAVDIPSGVEGSTGRVGAACFRAQHTVAFALPKLGNLIPPGADYNGELYIVDISIPPALSDSLGLTTRLIDEDLVNGLIPCRAREAHKGDSGRVFIVGGSVGLTGAAALAATAALRTGAGLVTVGIPCSLNPIMEVKLTEVMTKPLPETADGSFSPQALEPILEFAAGSGALAIGPGLSQNPGIRELVSGVLSRAVVPLVIDADGLNALVGHTDLLKQLKVPVVLTPHPGEMSRLTGKSIAEIQADRLGCARAAAAEWGVIIVLKGAGTVVACPDGRCWLNSSGNPGLATGGTGDVLTGVIAGLLGQGLSPVDAAVVGVYIHGLAGDYLAAGQGILGMAAGDLAEAIPTVLNKWG